MYIDEGLDSIFDWLVASVWCLCNSSTTWFLKVKTKFATNSPTDKTQYRENVTNTNLYRVFAYCATNTIWVWGLAWCKQITTNSQLGAIFSQNASFPFRHHTFDTKTNTFRFTLIHLGSITLIYNAFIYTNLFDEPFCNMTLRKSAASGKRAHRMENLTYQHSLYTSSHDMWCILVAHPWTDRPSPSPCPCSRWPSFRSIDGTQFVFRCATCPPPTGRSPASDSFGPWRWSRVRKYDCRPRAHGCEAQIGVCAIQRVCAYFDPIRYTGVCVFNDQNEGASI